MAKLYAFAIVVFISFAAVKGNKGHRTQQKLDQYGRDGDEQTKIKRKDLNPVNGDFEDQSKDVFGEFFDRVDRFGSRDVITTKGSAPEKRKAENRALGGFVLNFGQFSSDQQSVPENVFGERHTTHLIEDGCQPLGFPYVCEVRELIERSYKCPVDVPYCQRIPCSGNPHLNQDMTRCLKQPGCCFDQVLYNYRRYYGETVLPRVPVCHMAVRNEHFHTMARRFADQFRGWNPLLTNCLIKSNRNEIERNSIECSTLEVFEYFGFKAKHAGWTDILPRECGLISGCWRPGLGCFYPPRMTHLQLRSSYEHPRSRPYSPFDLYGQPMCLPMNPYANSEDFLDQYHQCLASGCEMDPAVTPNVILHHLNNVSSLLPSHLASSFKYEIKLGKVRPDNWHSQIQNFKKYGKLHSYALAPRQSGPQIQPAVPPQVPVLMRKFPPPVSMSPQSQPLPFNYIPQPVPHQQSLFAYQTRTMVVPNHLQRPGLITPAHRNYPAPPLQFRNSNPNAFTISQTYGQPIYQTPGRYPPQQQISRVSHTYSPSSPDMNLYPMACPFAIPRIPNFPPLDGKFDGCCDRNLCYIPRNSVRQQYSGAAAYWGPWSFWSRCSFACGNAVQKRYRTCIGPDPSSCAGPQEDRRACYNLPSCGQNFSQWSQWSDCKKACGGTRARTRQCKVQTCYGSLREKQECPKKCNDRKSERSRSSKDD